MQSKKAWNQRADTGDDRRGLDAVIERRPGCGRGLITLRLHLDDQGIRQRLIGDAVFLEEGCNEMTRSRRS